MEVSLPFGRWNSISHLSSALVELGRLEAIIQLLISLPGVSCCRTEVRVTVSRSVITRASCPAWWSSAFVEARVVGGIVVCVLRSKVGILNRDEVDSAMLNRKFDVDSATPPVFLCFRIEMVSLVEVWAVGFCNTFGASRRVEP